MSASVAYLKSLAETTQERISGVPARLRTRIGSVLEHLRALTSAANAPPSAYTSLVQGLLHLYPSEIFEEPLPSLEAIEAEARKICPAVTRE